MPAQPHLTSQILFQGLDRAVHVTCHAGLSLMYIALDRSSAFQPSFSVDNKQIMDETSSSSKNYIASPRNRSPTSSSTSSTPRPIHTDSRATMHAHFGSSNALPPHSSGHSFAHAAIPSSSMQQNHFPTSAFHPLPSDASNYPPYQTDTVNHGDESTDGLFYPYISYQDIASIPSLAAADQINPFDGDDLPINSWMPPSYPIYPSTDYTTSEPTFLSLPEQYAHSHHSHHSYDPSTSLSTSASPSSTIASPLLQQHQPQQQEPHPQPQPPSPSSSSHPSTPPNITSYGQPNADGTWRCAYPGCTSQTTFRRACDLRKHYTRHRKHLFCRHVGCPQATRGGFSSSKDRARHEAKHNPGVLCEWDGCGRVFSRVDNMKDHVRRIHKR